MATAKKAAPTKTSRIKEPAFKPRKGEVLEFTRRNGEKATGKYQETVLKGKGLWYVLKVEGMRRPTADVRPSEVRRIA